MYRNWIEIAKVEDENDRSYLGITDLDSSVGERLMHDYPQCFSKEKPVGAAPLSVLRAYAYAEAEASVEGDPDLDMLQDRLFSYLAVNHYGIPCMAFATKPKVEQEQNLPRLASTIPATAKTGDIVIFDGAQYVIVENNVEAGMLFISPAEYIDVNS